MRTCNAESPKKVNKRFIFQRRRQGFAPQGHKGNVTVRRSGNTNLDKLAGPAGDHVGAVLLAEQRAHHIRHPVQVGLLGRLGLASRPLRRWQEPGGRQ